MVPSAVFAILVVALAAGVNGGSRRNLGNVTAATYGEFPYQVSLRVKGKHYCGGALISKHHILTTAYCVVGVSELTVVTGAISITSAGEVYTPTRIVYHRLYQPTSATSAFDIAVITVSDDIHFNRVQNKISLPTAPTPTGFLATATGWGFINTNSSIVSPKLNKIKLPIIRRDQCEQMYGPSIKINRDQICTFSGRGLCAIESGGPLVYNNELIGMLSYGIGCDLGAPDVFTSVYQLLPWVNATMNA